MEAPTTDVVPSVEATFPSHDEPADPKPALTPPTSEDMDKRGERMSSELSELESSDDEEEIEPDHYFDGGKIPVFKPTMDQFRSFKKFIDKIDKYGMKSGIVKVIPPKEWRDSLPDLSESVKTIKVKNPIMQEFAGQHGIYTQANIEKQRSYNLPEWRALTDEPHHLPPARRGERRRAAAEGPSRTTRSARTQPSAQNTDDVGSALRRGPGRPRRRGAKPDIKQEEEDEDVEVPPTPKSPGKDEAEKSKEKRSTRTKIKKEDKDKDSSSSSAKAKGRQPRSTTSRRMNNRTAIADYIDEEAFEGFDYHLPGLEEYTVERCKELEDNYWKTINYGQPMYGADMPGSLFDDRTTSWNVAKLENLLDVLGTKVPGVNTAYLYLGMWKATFAWHLEDVDLYSINYIHFGAPKQWYSISQEDARRFEAAMKSIWPRDAKNCSQFLRHKTYLISPAQLEKQFNIKVNRLVHYEGEFVITYPYGYHSGYNLGYNCAESVNFANEGWLNYGRIAKKCECESDSVWVDVNEIERKLRGEPTPEYYEETDDEEEEGLDHLPSPPPSVAGKNKSKAGRKSTNKRKRANEEPKDAPKQKRTKRIRIRIKVPGRGMPCVLCPNDVDYDELLTTDNGLKAHRLCADYTPETYISSKPNELVCNVANIGKDRLDLKCNYCRSKRGAVFQCSQKKCTRAFHATCAAAAGVQVDLGPMPTFDEEGTEYFYDGYDFRCRFHRPKKRNPKKITTDVLENDKFIMEYARTLKPKDVVQFQYLDTDMYQIHGGLVVENRPGEQSVLVDILLDGDRVEVEWKYLLHLDPADSERPKPSANAKPLPEHLKENDSSLAITNRTDGVPEIGDAFHDPNSTQKWAEFHTAPEVTRRIAKVDMDKPYKLWHYLGKKSTEARPQYTDDLAKPIHNPKSNFLDTVKPAPLPIPPMHRQAYPAAYTMKPAMTPYIPQTPVQQQIRPSERPYQYKPKVETNYRSPAYNYSPDTRKNPNSPVAHQPNVVYDHRTSGHQYSPTAYSNTYQQRPSPTFHQYHPPQGTSTGSKPLPPSGHLLNGMDRYAASNPSLPPYPYHAPAASETINRLPPFPYAPPPQHPGYSSPAQSTPVSIPSAQHQATTPGAAPLANILSKSTGSSNSPIPDGGFTRDWPPKPTNGRLATNADPSRAPSAADTSSQGRALGYNTTSSLSLPPLRPTPQFQSADAFQRDMAKAPTAYSVMPKWESMMRRLKSSTGSPSPSSAAVPPTPPTNASPLPPPRHPSASHARPKTHTPPIPPHSEPQPASNMSANSKESPKRPEYSPISDVDQGSTVRPTASPLPPPVTSPLPPPVHAGETWKYS